MTTHPLRHLTPAQALLARPGMFTPNGSLCEFVSFLSGYQLSRQTNSSTDSQSSELDSIETLIVWLANEYDANLELFSHQLFDKMLARHASEDAAFEYLRKRFVESED